MRSVIWPIVKQGNYDFFFCICELWKTYIDKTGQEDLVSTNETREDPEGTNKTGHQKILIVQTKQEKPGSWEL